MPALKKVKVRAVIEYEINMPSDWDRELILFHLNEGTRCKDHIIEELQSLGGRDKEGYDHCLCMISEYQLVEETDTTTKKDSNDS